jgi:hypothetical protein
VARLCDIFSTGTRYPETSSRCYYANCIYGNTYRAVKSAIRRPTGYSSMQDDGKQASKLAMQSHRSLYVLVHSWVIRIGELDVLLWVTRSDTVPTREILPARSKHPVWLLTLISEPVGTCCRAIKANSSKLWSCSCTCMCNTGYVQLDKLIMIATYAAHKQVVKFYSTWSCVDMYIPRTHT